jgi:DNA-binding MarR family transcriptional regulator/CheY-like chemotaxis protein
MIDMARMYVEYDLKQVALVANDPTNQFVLTAVIEGAGSRVKAALTPSESVEWFSSGRRADMILLNLSHDDPSIPAMLRECNAAAERQRIPILACSSIDMIDSLYSGLDPEWATLLCAPEHEDLAAAFSVASGGAAPSFADNSSDMDTQRLRRLADEVSRIARTLATLSATPQPPGGYASSLVSDFQTSFRHEAPVVVSAAALPPPEDIRRTLRLRRLRDSFFDGSLFADPAWDILLDLAAARQEMAQVAVSSLCIAAAVPPTTALRWIKAMTDHGLLERVADPEDGRRIFIQLSDTAVAALSRYFDAVQKMGGATI